jgi:hypothetical protein
MKRSNFITQYIPWQVVRRFHLQLHRVRDMSKVSEALPDEHVTPVLADVNLVGVHVLPEVAAAGGVQVGLDVVAPLKDVVSLGPAETFPEFSHGFSSASASLEEMVI